MAEFMDKVIGILTTVGAKILLAIVVFIVGRIIINALSKALDKIRGFSKLDQTVQSFIHSLVRIGLNMLLIIAIIQVLGIPMTSVITVLASAGLATSGAEGVVKEITVFYTHILTLDNKRIIVPNGGLMNANVTNYSYENTRRVDLVFKAAFGTDQNLVLGLMLKAAEGTKGVLADPAPFARFSGCADNAQEFTLRAWCNTADYWDVYFDLLQNVSGAFGQAGIAAPATKLDVTMEK